MFPNHTQIGERFNRVANRCEKIMKSIIETMDHPERFHEPHVRLEQLNETFDDYEAELLTMHMKYVCFQVPRNFVVRI